jgi:osmotically-inducible protein OsmY
MESLRSAGRAQRPDSQMNIKTIFSRGSALLLLFGLILATGACASSKYSRSTGEYIDDKSISTKAKAALFDDPAVSGFDVGVQTFRGRVQLSGFVESEQQKARAGEIVRGIDGVVSVQNDVQVKPIAVGATTSTLQQSGRDTSRDANLQPSRAANEPVRASETAIRPADDLRIEITGSTGRALIRGTVRSEAVKESIGQQVNDLPGVQRVDNQLHVRP